MFDAYKGIIVVVIIIIIIIIIIIFTIIIINPIIIIILRYVHGRVGIDHLPENIMMGKTAAVVKLNVSMTGDKKEVEIDKDGKGNGDVGSIQDVGRKLAMHVVSYTYFLLRLALLFRLLLR